MSTSWRRCSAALGAVDLVVCTGGLGPTEDDITRDALARALGCRWTSTAHLDHPPAFERRGLTMPEINRRQAMVPRGATVLPNRERDRARPVDRASGTAIVLLPGPPREMTPMLEARRSPIASRRGRRRRTVPARAEDHRTDRIGRRRARAADLRDSGCRRRFRLPRRFWPCWARSNCT